MEEWIALSNLALLSSAEMMRLLFARPFPG